MKKIILILLLGIVLISGCAKQSTPTHPGDIVYEVQCNKRSVSCIYDDYDRCCHKTYYARISADRELNDYEAAKRCMDEIGDDFVGDVSCNVQFISASKELIFEKINDTLVVKGKKHYYDCYCRGYI